MPKYTGINHLAMATGDMDATIRFWRDLLKMRLVAGLGRPGYRHYFFEISPHDMIAFFEWDGVQPRPMKDHGFPVKGPFVFDHVAVGVASEEDLWDVKDRLEAAGFDPSEVVDHGFIQSVYAFDPNGIAIEFAWAVDEHAPRRRPAMVDRKPCSAAHEGPEPQSGHWPKKAVTPRNERASYPGEGHDFDDPAANKWNKG